MKEYSSYVSKLEQLASLLLANPSAAPLYEKEIKSALNGGPKRALRREVPIQELKKTGSFFTGEQLIGFISPHLEGQKANDIRAFDPACGVGDLLVFAAKSLPLGKNLRETFSFWGKRLFGHDLHHEFVRATKARLVISAFGGDKLFEADPLLSVEELFPNIVTADGLETYGNYPEVSNILINPPFYKIAAPRACGWAQGKVSAAAVFLDVCVTKSLAGTRIVAILPDVLRSGTFYKRWRERIGSVATVEKIEVFGQFDKWTDISVFVLYLTVLESKQERGFSSNWWKPVIAKQTVGDYFDVSVGAVVPFRDAEEGPEYSYVQPKGLQKWAVIRSSSDRRRFLGSTTKAPFVVVRRNSRFEDSHRATGTIISGLDHVAVENHLIVLKPKDSKLKTCKGLLDVLKSPGTNDWLNERIRCRHLTVSAVREIPWINDGE